MTHRTYRSVLGLALLLVLGSQRAASARLGAKEWNQVSKEAKRLFAEPGHGDEKKAVLARLVQDGERRSWKLLVEALAQEAGHWIATQEAVREKEFQIDEVQRKPISRRYPQEQTNLGAWRQELEALEAAASGERAVLDGVVDACAEGPTALRESLYRRAKGKGDWALRAAAAQVAAVHGEEKASLEFLARVLGSDKDPRVRGAAIEAVGASIEGLEAVPQPGAGKATGAASPAETLLLERLEDPDWGVQLLAVRLVDEKHLTKAVPYLINALTKATPRLAIAIGSALRSLTRENFEDYARPWALWWEDHKEEFETKDHRVFPPGAKVWPDAFFYGIRIRSDRVLFVIDTSASMKLATRNPNPAAPWRPPPQAGGGMPPPPPPEEILSGPKIDVARHELKKAIQKLPRTAKFNIIAFNTGVYSWRDTMQVADDATKKEALAWIRALQPKGLTFLDGALRLAFRMAGLPACGWVGREADVDTIVLLSDGLPTTDEPIDAKLMDPERILEHVKAWNRHGRIVVNCIAVSDVEDLDFLRVLAERNGGEFVDR